MPRKPKAPPEHVKRANRMTERAVVALGADGCTDDVQAVTLAILANTQATLALEETLRLKGHDA